jgi:hypothetical protein
MWGFLSDKRTGLVLQLLVAFARENHHHILLSLIRDSPKPGRAGLHISIGLEQDDPIISPSNEFHFCHLIKLSGLWWRIHTHLHVEITKFN